MTETSTMTAGIDASKAQLDIALHGRTERWQVANTLPGWRRLAAEFVKAGVMRVGIFICVTLPIGDKRMSREDPRTPLTHPPSAPQ